MSSLLRRKQRKIARDNGSFENKSAQYRNAGPGGYDVCHPTKGWRHYSAARLRAQARLAEMLHAIDRRMGRAL